MLSRGHTESIWQNLRMTERELCRWAGGKWINLVTQWQHLAPLTGPKGIFQKPGHRPPSNQPSTLAQNNNSTVTQRAAVTFTPRQKAAHTQTHESGCNTRHINMFYWKRWSHQDVTELSAPLMTAGEEEEEEEEGGVVVLQPGLRE